MSVIVASGAAARMAAEEAVARSDFLLSARIVPPLSAIAFPIAAPVPDVVPVARNECQYKYTDRNHLKRLKLALNFHTLVSPCLP